MNRLICSAIDNRYLLSIEYDPGHRIVEPHAYGLGSDGKELLRAFQTEGASASGEQKEWKLFRVDRITRLTVLW